MSMMPEDFGDITILYKHSAYISPAGPHPEPHLEKDHPEGDQLNQRIAWHNLVAKPVPRNVWGTNTRAMAAANTEWDKLRKADGG